MQSYRRFRIPLYDMALNIPRYCLVLNRCSASLCCDWIWRFQTVRQNWSLRLYLDLKGAPWGRWPPTLSLPNSACWFWWVYRMKARDMIYWLGPPHPPPCPFCNREIVTLTKKRGWYSWLRSSMFLFKAVLVSPLSLVSAAVSRARCLYSQYSAGWGRRITANVSTALAT